MTLQGKAIPALVAGSALALFASGCATWHADSMHEARASNVPSTTTTGPVGNRGPVMGAIDEQTTSDVEEAFHADHALDSHDIRVGTLRGVVTLEGTVRDEAQRRRAVDIARGMSHVVGVEDHLRVTG